MKKINMQIAILSSLIIAVLLSGCYTIVGYPPEMEAGITEEVETEGQRYTYYEGYYERPYTYFWDYYDPYYGLRYPSYYDRDYYYSDPWRYGNRYRYYNDYYAPLQQKPESRKRESSQLRRTPRPESKRGSVIEKDEEQKKLDNETRIERKIQNRNQQPTRLRRAPSSGSERDSSKQKDDEDEE